MGGEKRVTLWLFCNFFARLPYCSIGVCCSSVNAASGARAHFESSLPFFFFPFLFLKAGFRSRRVKGTFLTGSLVACRVSIQMRQPRLNHPK